MFKFLVLGCLMLSGCTSAGWEWTFRRNSMTKEERRKEDVLMSTMSKMEDHFYRERERDRHFCAEPYNRFELFLLKYFSRSENKYSDIEKCRKFVDPRYDKAWCEFVFSEEKGWLFGKRGIDRKGYLYETYCRKYLDKNYGTVDSDGLSVGMKEVLKSLSTQDQYDNKLSDKLFNKFNRKK